MSDRAISEAPVPMSPQEVMDYFSDQPDHIERLSAIGRMPTVARALTVDGEAPHPLDGMVVGPNGGPINGADRERAIDRAERIDAVKGLFSTIASDRHGDRSYKPSDILINTAGTAFIAGAAAVTSVVGYFKNRP